MDGAVFWHYLELATAARAAEAAAAPGTREWAGLSREAALAELRAVRCAQQIDARDAQVAAEVSGRADADLWVDGYLLDSLRRELGRRGFAEASTPPGYARDLARMYEASGEGGAFWSALGAALH
jgi:hypothetical protein